MFRDWCLFLVLPIYVFSRYCVHHYHCPTNRLKQLRFLLFLSSAVVQPGHVNPQEWGVCGWGCFTWSDCKKWRKFLSPLAFSVQHQHHCSVSSEPFMSLLLVLSHMEFKLDMEVSSTALFMPLKTANACISKLFHTQNFPKYKRDCFNADYH